MPDDAKEIMETLNSGKLPDITACDQRVRKGLAVVRYNRSLQHSDNMDVPASLPEDGCALREIAHEFKVKSKENVAPIAIVGKKAKK